MYQTTHYSNSLKTHMLCFQGPISSWKLTHMSSGLCIVATLVRFLSHFGYIHGLQGASGQFGDRRHSQATEFTALNWVLQKKRAYSSQPGAYPLWFPHHFSRLYSERDSSPAQSLLRPLVAGGGHDLRIVLAARELARGGHKFRPDFRALKHGDGRVGRGCVTHPRVSAVGAEATEAFVRREALCPHQAAQVVQRLLLDRGGADVYAHGGRCRRNSHSQNRG